MNTLEKSHLDISDKLGDWLVFPPEYMSRLEKMQYLMNQAMPGRIHMKIIELGDHEVTGVIPFLPETANLMGAMHGGTIFTLGDTLAACLLWVREGVGRAFVTTQANIRYIRPITEGQCFCRVKILKTYGQRVDLQADLYNDDGKRAARQKMTYIIINQD